MTVAAANWIRVGMVVATLAFIWWMVRHHRLARYVAKKGTPRDKA